MAFCRECGAEVEQTARVCHACGAMQPLSSRLRALTGFPALLVFVLRAVVAALVILALVIVLLLVSRVGEERACEDAGGYWDHQAEGCLD